MLREILELCSEWMERYVAVLHALYLNVGCLRYSMFSEILVILLQVASMGLPGVNPAVKVGKYVKPKERNKLISDPNSVCKVLKNPATLEHGMLYT